MVTRIIVFVLLTNVSALTQVQDSSELHSSPAMSTAFSDSTDYRIGAGDLIEITVFGVSSLNQEVRVSASGQISMPLLGKIPVEGVSGQGLEDLLAKLITEKALIRDPQVSVFIKEYQSQPIYVLGAVNQPGQYMMTRQLTIMDALTMAGGLNLAVAGDFATVQRTRHGISPLEEKNAEIDPEKNSIRIDLVELIQEGQLDMNLPIRGGDVIYVPERKISVYYVVGEVGNPGVYPLPRESDPSLLLTQAVTQAGGPGQTAKMSKGILVRYDEAGMRQELAVDFKAILKGKNPDLPVEPNDVIFIPGSNVKTVGYGLLRILPGTISSGLIWGGAWRRF